MFDTAEKVMKPLTSENLRGNWATVLLPVNKDDSINYPLVEEEEENTDEKNSCPLNYFITSYQRKCKNTNNI